MADLVAMKAILPLREQGLYNTVSDLKAIPSDGPMGTGGLMTAMGTVGDRPDIGFITDYQANYLLRGSSAPLQTLMTQAEDVGSMPI